MGGLFRESMADSGKFVITLELVPGPEAQGRSVDLVKAMAEAAIKDGRISAVGITDNPSGNPALSPDVLGREILDLGMEVMVHFSCRDMNRSGIESRALQLAYMGMKNILALTGDYTGQGFGGQAAPVFDLDSVTLTCMLNLLNERDSQTEVEDGFWVGCAVSPFKSNEGETFAQYAKLCRKAAAGARFVITQLGYDARKFHELLQVQKDLGINLPTLASVYHLTPGFARAMHDGKVPGAVVTRKLLDTVMSESEDKEQGREAAIERTARLAVVLKGLGYRGMQLGGIHKSFKPVEKILNRMAEIEDQWREFVPYFDFPQDNGFYMYTRDPDTGLSSQTLSERALVASTGSRVMFDLLRCSHELFFKFDAPCASFSANLAAKLDKAKPGRGLVMMAEDPVKLLLLSCKKCGDCGIQHVGFLCPESQCPKFLRNGACGGSSEGMCEVYPEKKCVWVQAYERLAAIDKRDEMAKGCIPPKLQELDGTSSWLNFHLRRDHQSVSCELSKSCSTQACPTERITRIDYEKIF